MVSGHLYSWEPKKVKIDITVASETLRLLFWWTCQYGSWCYLHETSAAFCEISRCAKKSVHIIFDPILKVLKYKDGSKIFVWYPNPKMAGILKCVWILMQNNVYLSYGFWVIKILVLIFVSVTKTSKKCYSIGFSIKNLEVSTQQMGCSQNLPNSTFL